MTDNELHANYLVELRRGSLVLAVLACLGTPQYGYSLLQALKERGIEIEANTLYPLLRRLEGQGLLEAAWDTSESRPRKYYRINAAGNQLYSKLLAEWRELSARIGAIVKEGTPT
jgi:DNA-binding PadR family transcriptional regulator